MVLLNMLYKIVLTFEPVDEILKCDHSNANEQNFPVVLFNMPNKMPLTLGE